MRTAGVRLTTKCRCRVATADQILHAARHAVDRKGPTRRLVRIRRRRYRAVTCAARLAGFEYEVFAALFLDGHNRLIEYVEMFRGTIDQTSVYPREVVKEALRLDTRRGDLFSRPSRMEIPSRAAQTRP